MKKSFYEFMDNYEPNNFTEQNDVSVESVKSRTMEKIAVGKSERSYKLTKKTFAAFAAVCIAAVTGVAVTAYEIGVFDLAVNFFSNNISSESSQLLSENDYEAIRNNLKEEHIVTESEGATVELTGSMHDENVVYLFCTMTLPEGTVLPDDFKELAFEVQSTDYYSLRDKEYELGMACSGLTVNFADYNMPGSNTVDFTCIVNLCGDWQTDSLSGFLIEDLIDMNQKQIIGTDESRCQKSLIQKGKWLVPIKSDTKIESAELLNESIEANILVDKPDNIHYQEMSFESVKISPLSIEVIGKNNVKNTKENMKYFPDTLKNDLSIVMNDGMEETRFNGDFLGGGISNEFYYELLIFETPINVSKIDYIKIGDAEIKMN